MNKQDYYKTFVDSEDVGAAYLKKRRIRKNLKKKGYKRAWVKYLKDKQLLAVFYKYN